MEQFGFCVFGNGYTTIHFNNDYTILQIYSYRGNRKLSSSSIFPPFVVSVPWPCEYGS